MGTKGWFVFLYKGVYYRYSKSHDSNFEGLGSDLISKLKAGGHELLEALRTFFGLGEVLDGKIAAPEDPEQAKSWAAARGRTFSEFFQHDGADQLVHHEEHFLIGERISVEYIYLIDLDKNRFYATCEEENIIFIYNIDQNLIPEVLEWARRRRLPKDAN